MLSLFWLNDVNDFGSFKDNANSEPDLAFFVSKCLLQPEHQQLIVDNGALKHLVDLLERHNDGLTSRAIASLIRRAADAITNLAHENSSVKTRVRFASSRTST